MADRVEQVGWADEVVDPRPLRRLGLVSVSVLVAGVVLLVHEHRRGAGGPPVVALVVVWVLVLLAGLLLLGAVGGLLSRSNALQQAQVDPVELHDRQVVRALLRRGDDPPPALAGQAQRVVDDEFWSWTPWLWVALGGYWVGTAFTYAGWGRWLHLGAGLFYLVLAVPPLRDRRRVLRAAARLGVRPRRGPSLRRPGPRRLR